MITERALTKEELKLLDINDVYHRQRVTKKFGWKRFSLLLLVLAAIWGYSIYSSKSSDTFGAFFISFIAVWIQWLLYKGHKEDKVESKKTLAYLKTLRAKNSVRVTTYTCKRAILFEEYEDEGICHALEVGENQLYFFWDIHEFGTSQYLPNTKFEVYEDKELPYVLGQDLNIIGLPFQPIKIKRAIKWELWNILPNQNGVENISLDDFLDQIEQSLKETNL